MSAWKLENLLAHLISEYKKEALTPGSAPVPHLILGSRFKRVTTSDEPSEIEAFGLSLAPRSSDGFISSLLAGEWKDLVLGSVGAFCTSEREIDPAKIVFIVLLLRDGINFLDD